MAVASLPPSSGLGCPYQSESCIQDTHDARGSHCEEPASQGHSAPNHNLYPDGTFHVDNQPPSCNGSSMDPLHPPPLALITCVVRAAQTFEQFAVGTQPFPRVQLEDFNFGILEEHTWALKASQALSQFFSGPAAALSFQQVFGYSRTSWSGRFELAILEPPHAADADWLVIAVPTVRNMALLVNSIVHAAHPRRAENSGTFTAFGNVLLLQRRRLNHTLVQLLGTPDVNHAMTQLWKLPSMQRSLRCAVVGHVGVPCCLYAVGYCCFSMEHRHWW
jgi:hypothetical protein